MLQNSIGENPSIALQSNWLTVNGSPLRADILPNANSEKIPVSAVSLEAVLLLGRRSILQGIEEFYEQQVAMHPGAAIAKPSVWAAQLGTTRQTDGRNGRVFTEKGYANGGVNTSIGEIQPRFHGHWDAVRDAGFLPEVRRTSDGQDGGAWLLLRKPSLDEVLRHWFDKKDGAINNLVERFRDDDKGLQCRNLREYRMIGEVAAEEQPDFLRSRAQIGLLLSMAAIKSTLGDKSGYEDEIDDVFTYVDNDTRIDVSTVRAIENSTFEINR
jgi:hypothetical protein